MAHLDLGAFLADDSLTLDNIASAAHPEGRSYTIAAPHAEDWLRLQRIMAAGTGSALDPDTVADWTAFCTGPDGEVLDFRTKLLGPALAEMLADGVRPDVPEIVERIVLTHFGLGSSAAITLVRRTAEAALGEARARADRAQETPSTTSPAAATTAKSTAGSKSSRASTATRARSSARTSTRSSTTTARKPAKRAAKKTA